MKPRQLAHFKRTKPLSWKPVRRGDVYCSPACGMGCSRADYEKAVKESAKLAAALGPRFKPRVWENLGWHYSADSGRCWDGFRALASVHKNSRYSYTAFLNTATQFLGDGRSPQAALRKAVRAAKAHIAALRLDLAKLGAL